MKGNRRRPVAALAAGTLCAFVLALFLGVAEVPLLAPNASDLGSSSAAGLVQDSSAEDGSEAGDGAASDDAGVADSDAAAANSGKTDGSQTHDQGVAAGKSDDSASSVSEKSLSKRQVVTGDDGSQYAAGELLLTSAEGVSEQEAMQSLKNQGVQVTEVQALASDGGGALVLQVSYKGNADPADLCEALEADGVSFAAEPDYLATINEGVTWDGEDVDADEGVDGASVAADDASSNDDEDVDVDADEDAVAADDNVAAEATDTTSTPSYICDDPHASSYGFLAATGAIAAWNTVRTRGQVTVAVIDTGADYSHPDLVKNLVSSAYAVNVVDELSDGSYVYGVSAVTDRVGHGTQVAGIVAAEADNAEGVAGVSYNAKVLPVMAYDVVDKGFYASDLVQALDYLVACKKSGVPELQNIRVVNMSLGMSNWVYSLKEAIDRAHEAGIMVCAATGNEYTGVVNYPAAYDNVVAVASVGVNGDGTYGSRSRFSNYGGTVDLAAPGESVLSTCPLALTSEGYLPYYYSSGTSMATPMVSGSAALLLTAHPELSVDEAEYYLELGAEDLGKAGRDDETGWGGVRIDRSLVAADTDLALEDAVISPISQQRYTGKSVCPKLTVRIGDFTLREGVDYKATYSDNVKLGTAQVTLVGKGKVSGSASATFTIRALKAGEAFTYNSCTYKVTKTGSSPEVRLESVSSKATSVTVPKTAKLGTMSYKVTSLKASAFAGHKYLKTVSVSYLQTIPSKAFYKCPKLATVTLGSGVKTVGSYAFYRCPKLSKVSVGAGVRSIGTKAFYGCGKLATVYLKTTHLSSSKVGSKAFGGTYAKAKVKCYKKLSSYKKWLPKKGFSKKVRYYK